MHKDRMFKRKCNRTSPDEPTPVEGDSPVEFRSRTRQPKAGKNFAKVSSRFSITLQELKEDVPKVVARHRFVSGDVFWHELRLFDERVSPSTNTLLSAIEFDQDEDLDSGCEDEETEQRSSEQEEFEDFQSEKFQKPGWLEHVELYLERSDQIPQSDLEYMSEVTDQQENQSQSFMEVSTLPSELDFTLTSSMEVDSVADVVYKLIEQISDEMFSPIEEVVAGDDAAAAAVPVTIPGNVPSDAGYLTASGQDETMGEINAQPGSQHPASSSVASGKEATGRGETSAAAPSNPVVATPLHARSVPRIRSALKKQSAIEPPSTIKKRVTFSDIGGVMNPYEERDRRVFLENHQTKALNDSNILEHTLPRQQSTPKVDHTKSRGAKRKCVYEFDDDDDDESKDKEASRSATASTQTDSTDNTEEMIRTIVQHTINSFKEAEQTKSEEDSTERAIQAILQATAASFHVDEPKKKKRKKKQNNVLNESIAQLHKKVDRLEKRQRRMKKARRLIVKKVVPATPKPSTDRCTQTDAPATAEVSVATTFELSKPPPKTRAPRKRASRAKAKQPGDPAVTESSAPKAKRARRKVDRDQQTIPQCLNGDGGGGSSAAAAAAAVAVPEVADVIPEPKKAAGRKVVEQDVVRMEDGQLVAEDSEDNLSQSFEIEESLPPLSPAPSRTIVDPRMIKGVHRKPPSIIDTQPNSPGNSSQPESPASHYSFANLPDDDEDTESFNQKLILLRIGAKSQPSPSSSSGSSKQRQKSRRQKPYPKNPKLRPPPAKLVSQPYMQTLYLSPTLEPTPTIVWKDPRLLPWDTCKYIEQRLQPVISENRLPSLQQSYGEPCWFISLNVALELLTHSDDVEGDGGTGTDDMAVPRYPLFSQEFSPIAFAEGFQHVDDEDVDGREYSNGSDVPDD